MTKMKSSITVMIGIIACLAFQMPVYASDGEEYITISVDAVDENGNLKYALDTDDPAAFTDSNEFVVLAGTSHTIYVKDAAGNISSQKYLPENENESQYVSNTEIAEDEHRINIDLEIGGDSSSQKEYEITDNPVEPGSASVSSKIKTDGSDDAEKVFYTFSTKEGETLYLVIDQSQGSDNVYLLDTVSLGDLKVLADGQPSSYESDNESKEDNLLSALTVADDESTGGEEEQVTKKAGGTSKSNAVIILIVAAVGGGAYYYLKVYKNKKDEAMDVMDAMDLDEFEPEEEEEELDFDYDDDEKEKYLADMIKEDESLYDVNPDEYAASHMDEDDYDAGIEPDEIDGYEPDNDDIEDDEEEE